MTTATTLEIGRTPTGRTSGSSVGAPRAKRLAQIAPSRVTGSNLVGVRDHNQLLVLQLVRTRGPSTRRDLSRSTGLTFQTIENISRRLIDAGILEDVAAPTGGDRARRLALRPAGAHAVGIEVTPGEYRVVLCDLAGRAVAEERRLRGAQDAFLDDVALTVQDLIDDAEVFITTVVAAGLTVRGPLPDAPAGRGLPSGPPATSVDRVCTELERRLTIPVFCPSGVVAAARAEQWTARVQSRDFIYLHLASEIGCAVVTHGRLCRGSRGRGGDIAHTPTTGDGELCTCGRRGCLHTLLAECGLRGAVAAALGASEPPTLEHVARLVASDPRVAAVIERAAGHVADALLPAVRLLDPELVIVGGPVAEALGATFRDAVEREIAVARDEAPGPAVRRAQPDAGGAAGAAQYVLHEIFAPAPP
jgi:predicted NBD/HSP70 family sugar kinase